MIDMSSLTGPGATSAIDTLVSQYMSVERQPVETLQSQRDQLNVRSAMFNDLKAKIDDLKSAAEALSSSTDSAFNAHSAVSSDTKLATVSAASNASSGTYALSEIQLAKSHQLKSADKGSNWTASGDSSFSINGTLVSVKAGATLVDVKYAINHALYDSDRKVTASLIGSTMTLEGRTGAAYAMKLADVSGTLLKDLGLVGDTVHEPAAPAAGPWEPGADTSNWSWTMDLGGSKQLNRFSWGVDLGAGGAAVAPKDYTIEYNDGSGTWKTLKTVTSNVMPDSLTKNEVFADITATQIRVKVASTGGGASSPPVIASASFFRDNAVIDNSAVIQGASDGSAKVNGIPAGTFSVNSGITNLVHGLTINLKSTDAVTLTVSDDTSSVKNKITSFFSKLNSLVDYLKTKSAVTKDTKTDNYTRGPLHGYYQYTDLSSNLMSDLQKIVSSALPGKPSRLGDVGVTMDSDLHFSVSDSSKLDTLLSSDPNAVAAYFGGADGVAKRVFDRLKPYVVTPAKQEGSTLDPKSYIQREQDSIQGEQDAIDDRIKSLNERLAIKENLYREQFTRLQALYIDAQQQQQRLQAIFSATSGYSSY